MYNDVAVAHDVVMLVGCGVGCVLVCWCWIDQVFDQMKSDSRQVVVI